MNRHVNIAVATSLMLFAFVPRTGAQVNIIDQTRSITITLNGTVNPSDTDTAPGSYSNSLGNGVTQTFSPQVQENDHVEGSQASQVSSTLLSDNASDSGQSTTFLPAQDVNADSSYSVDFSVNAPTPFSLTGTYTFFSQAHEGAYNTLGTLVTLTQTQGATQIPLYSGGFARQHDGGDFLQFGGNGIQNPLTPFSTTLLPGFSYNLTADVYLDVPADGATSGTTPNVGINFTATVPEPASAGLLCLCAGTLLARRRR